MSQSTGIAALTSLASRGHQKRINRRWIGVLPAVLMAGCAWSMGGGVVSAEPPWIRPATVSQRGPLVYRYPAAYHRPVVARYAQRDETGPALPRPALPATRAAVPSYQPVVGCASPATPLYSAAPASSWGRPIYRPIGGAPAGVPPYSLPIAQPSGYYVGAGLLGQPKAYVPGQPIRNFFRYLTP